jgi:hypothetical protein
VEVQLEQIVSDGRNLWDRRLGLDKPRGSVGKFILGLPLAWPGGFLWLVLSSFPFLFSRSGRFASGSQKFDLPNFVLRISIELRQWPNLIRKDLLLY